MKHPIKHHCFPLSHTGELGTSAGRFDVIAFSNQTQCKTHIALVTHTHLHSIMYTQENWALLPVCLMSLLSATRLGLGVPRMHSVSVCCLAHRCVCVCCANLCEQVCVCERGLAEGLPVNALNLSVCFILSQIQYSGRQNGGKFIPRGTSGKLNDRRNVHGAQLMPTGVYMCAYVCVHET